MWSGLPARPASRPRAPSDLPFALWRFMFSLGTAFSPCTLHAGCTPGPLARPYFIP